MNWPGIMVRHRTSTGLICCSCLSSTGKLRNPKHDFEARVNLATNSSRFSCDWSWGRYRRRSCLTFWQEQTLVFTLALTDSHCLRTHRSLQSTDHSTDHSTMVFPRLLATAVVASAAGVVKLYRRRQKVSRRASSSQKGAPAWPVCLNGPTFLS